MEAQSDDFTKQLKKTMSPSKLREFLIDNEYLSDVKFLIGDEDSRETLNGKSTIFLDL